MTPAMDEVSTEYGLLAEAMKYPPDYSSVTYRLRADAKWHDGQPVTADDVVWSFNVLTDKENGSPQQIAYYQHVTKAEKTGEREVTFTFDQAGNRELPQIVGQLNVLPKHWWEGTDASGNKRDITRGTLEPPLGSGPYRIKDVVAGRTISYERVPDYWGKDLNVNIGSNNLDEIRYEYFRDDTVELEAFKADQVDWRIEIDGAGLGDRLRLPGGEGEEGRPREVRGALPRPPASCRLHLQSEARTRSTIRGCARPSTSPSRSRTSTSRSSTASMSG